eukprot:CAMPEP_0114136958 /NCGR_PEP_ID=MMETSP0043_2-20121206/15520_1 /TAXON_ID=464988 /ORGANISM="Hemiselmis andersenii, Strain CCMP644" /LENGTH=49 /DNA_ID=CAMNT_0001230803 /DNA_START=541 /DNA_END=690 /DNA_ORIENTATION=+
MALSFFFCSSNKAFALSIRFNKFASCFALASSPPLGGEPAGAGAAGGPP